jgi:hypothetical protein
MRASDADVLQLRLLFLLRVTVLVVSHRCSLSIPRRNTSTSPDLEGPRFVSDLRASMALLLRDPSLALSFGTAAELVFERHAASGEWRSVTL